jgi:adenosylcobalamin-dependent ribonucleoside-triphosphate reductase
MVNDVDFLTFRLDSDFVDQYEDKKPPFGFNGLGELVFMRTYSRLKADGTKELWYETCERVVNGIYTIQKRHIFSHRLTWKEKKAQRSAQEMYDRLFNMKFLGSGRGLWALGTPIIEDKQLGQALCNCAFVSTRNIREDFADPFCCMMDFSMCGVGCGFDTKGAGLVKVEGPDSSATIQNITIEDSREGWVSSLRLLLNSYIHHTSPVEFDYSLIRPAGAEIKTFGGIAPGPQPLQDLHSELKALLNTRIGFHISERDIVDIMNLIGKCVVSGNLRRTAQIALGNPLSTEFLDLKNYEVNPDRASYGWSSNNSVVADLGMDYSHIAERTRLNGEPGYIWLDNARKFSRMVDYADDKDAKVCGLNPCSEQTLEDKELCNLCETFPARHEDYEDYAKTLKYAYLFAKTVTLVATTNPETNVVMFKNRRIGLSMSGVAQFITHRGLHELKSWCENGYKALKYYDRLYSDWFGIPKSIKISTLKPSGSLSLLPGATPGMHYPESRFYIRRMRLDKKSKLVKPLKKAGYHIEPDVFSKDTTLVVEIPVDIGEGIRTAKELSMWEQLSLAAFLQKYWSDNSVSVTVTFDPETEGHQIEQALNYFQYQLKAVSFLPRIEAGAYPQMPYEAIDEETYNKMVDRLKPIKFNSSSEDAMSEKYCDGDTCSV